MCQLNVLSLTIIDLISELLFQNNVGIKDISKLWITLGLKKQQDLHQQLMH